MSRLEKNLKRIATSLGASCDCNDNTTCELVGKIANQIEGNVIDVDTLPQPVWKGTPVPTSGYVEKVYFNTNLTNGEINNILDNLTNNTEYDYVPFYLDSADKRLFIDKENYEIRFGTNLSQITVYCDPDWEQTYLDIATEINTNGLNVDQNDKLSSLISITPFEPTIKPYTLYRCNGKLYYYNTDMWCVYEGYICIDGSMINFEADKTYNVSLGNGRYIVTTESVGVDFSIKLNFGKIPGGKYGKSILIGMESTMNFDYFSFFKGEDSFINIYQTGIDVVDIYYIEVDDYLVKITSMMDN